LAAQPSVRKRQQAIGILEGLRRQQPATADEQFLLARLYESVGAWRKTRSQMTELLSGVEEKLTHAASEPEKKTVQTAYENYLAYYSLNLLHRNELAEAR